MLTRAVAALGTEAQREILAALRRYDEFDADNDPYGEHDFGRITVQGHELLFKIDYYDQSLTLHSPDPSDPAIIHRVMTVMLAEDFDGAAPIGSHATGDLADPASLRHDGTPQLPRRYPGIPSQRWHCRGGREP